MEKRPFGKTGLSVTPLGVGSAELGFLGISQTECDRFLGAALDAGINVIDSAACYKDAEEKVGRAIAGRRVQYVLITKCGHHVEPSDPPEWTPEVIRHSAQRSLKRLRTDHLDVLLLHSCPAEVLERDEIIEALLRCRREGLTRWVGYSGDNADAQTAIALGRLDVLQLSVNLCDQQAIDGILPKARAAGMGVMTKRSVANGCWRDMNKYSSFYAGYAEPYVQRLKAMGFTPDRLGFDGSWMELALRFTAWQPGVHVALVGGRTADNLPANVRIVEKGPLPESVIKKIRDAWKSSDDGSWTGQV